VSKFFNSLFGRVVIALVVGVALGACFPQFVESLRPLDDGFLKLIKMVIGPIVFCVVVSGMANAGDLKKVGRVGLKAVVYFEVMTTLALAISLVLAWLTRPGVGMNVDLHSLDAASLASYAKNAESLKDTAGYLLKIIPETAIDAFAKGDIPQILVFSVLFGSALSLLGDKARRVNGLIVVLLVSLVTSKGAHGIPGSAIVILAATLSAIPAIPVLGLVRILPIDWFVGIARALTNLLGNCVATVVVAVWENDIDKARAKRVLDQELRYVPAGEPAPLAGDGAHAV